MRLDQLGVFYDVIKHFSFCLLSSTGQIPDTEGIHVTAIDWSLGLREMKIEKYVSGRLYLFGARYCL